MDYNTMLENEKRIKGQVDELFEKLTNLRGDYDRYRDIDERLIRGEVIDISELDEKTRLAKELESVQNEYNRTLNIYNGVAKEREAFVDKNVAVTKDFLDNKYNVAMQDALMEIENINKKLKEGSISEFEAELLLGKEKAAYEIANDHYQKFMENKVRESKNMDGYVKSVIDSNTVSRDADYYENLFKNPEIAQELDKNEAMALAKEAVNNLVNKGISIDEIDKIIYGDRKVEKTTEVKPVVDSEPVINNKEVGVEQPKPVLEEVKPDELDDYTMPSIDEIEDSKVDDYTMPVVDQIEEQPEKKLVVHDIDTGLPVEEEKNQEEVETDDYTYSDDFENISDDRLKSLTEHLTPEKEKKPSKIATCGKNLVEKIKNSTAAKAALVGIAASVALVLVNPALAAGLGLAVSGGYIGKEISAGRKL